MNNRSRWVLVAALVAFGLSFALPAYGEQSGWACLQVCWGALVDFNPKDFGAGLYFPGFVLTNVVFVYVGATAVARRAGFVRELLAVAAAGHVLSWPIINLLKSDGDFRAIEVGYYVWLAAYVTLVASLRMNRGEAKGA